MSAEQQRVGVPNSFDFRFIRQRAQEICLNPKTIWPKLRDEAATTQSLYIGYIAVLAAIPFVAQFLRMVTLGMTGPLGIHVRWSFLNGLIATIFNYALALAVIFIAAVALEKLAPKFGGSAGRLNGLKLAAYSMTPAMLAGILNLVPALFLLVLLAGIYSLYLFWAGIPVMTSVPQEKRLAYFGASIGVTFLAALILSVVVMSIAPSPAGSVSMNNEKIDLPGGVSVELDKFQKSMEQLQRALPQN